MIKFAICDDEPQMAQEIADQLAGYMKETGGYSVECFSSGYALLKSPDEFDVIFLDIQMEHPDGMETARLLRQRDNHSLLVFVTVLKECDFGPTAPLVSDEKGGCTRPVSFRKRDYSHHS